MAETFNNGESNLSIRTKLNANAEEINTNTEDITSLETEKAPIANPTFTGTVSGVTKAMVGLPNVDNTSDANKPVSTDTQTALNLKAPIASPTFTGTVSGITKAMVGLGSVDNTADASKPVSSAQAAALALKVDETTTVNGHPLSANVTVTKGDVGLGNADNTSDVNKPISALTSNALAEKATPADIETALTASEIFFDQNTFQGAIYPVPVPPQPAIGTAGNPIKAIGSGVVVDVVENGNTNAVSSNAVFQNTSTLRGGYTGSLQDLYDLIVSGNVTPAAPTDFIVDNTLNTAGFTENPLITDLDQYEYQILDGTITTVTENPFSVGDIDAPIGTVKVRIKAASGRNPSQWLVNETAYTAGAGAGINPLIFASMDSDVDVDSGTNTYTTTSGDTFDNKIWNSGKRLLADTDGAIYLQDSAGAVLGFASSNIGTYYGNMVIGMWHTNGNELFATENGQANAFVEAIVAGWDYRIVRTTTVHQIQKSDDSWATNTPVHTFVYTGTGILYPAGDIHSTGSELVNPRYSGLNNV